MKKMLLLGIITGQLVPAFAWRIEVGGNIIISQPVYEDLPGHTDYNALDLGFTDIKKR